METVLIVFTYLIVPIIKQCFIDISPTSNKWQSIVCTFLVVLISLFDTFRGCVAFLTYIIMDTFFRNDEILFENAVHHITCLLLTSVGLNIFDARSEKVIFTLLMMEITTPILHLTIMFKHKLLFGLLMILWIPFRIYYPLRMLHYFYYSFNNTFIILLGKITLSILQLLQIYWFFKLCVKGKDEIIKKLQTKYEV